MTAKILGKRTMGDSDIHMSFGQGKGSCVVGSESLRNFVGACVSGRVRGRTV